MVQMETSHKPAVEAVKHTARVFLHLRSQSEKPPQSKLYLHRYQTFPAILPVETEDSRITTMASSISTAVIFPLGFRNSPQNRPITTVYLSPFANKTSLSLSFTSSIAGFSPIVVQSVPAVASPSQNPKPLTVVSAKGYKMKTHKASAKRFRVSGSGRIMRRRAGKQHLLRKKNAKRRLRLSKMVQVDRSDYDNVIGALPYLKVNRKPN